MIGSCWIRSPTSVVTGRGVLGAETVVPHRSSGSATSTRRYVPRRFSLALLLSSPAAARPLERGSESEREARETAAELRVDHLGGLEARLRFGGPRP